METIRARLEAIARSCGIRDIYVFGSRSRWAQRLLAGEKPESVPDESDLDIAVQPRLGHRLDARGRVRLANEFEDLFDVPRVDLVVLSEASPFLAVDVLRGELLYTSDPVEQAEHELYILRRAGDLEPFQRARVRQILHEGGR